MKREGRKEGRKEEELNVSQVADSVYLAGRWSV